MTAVTAKNVSVRRGESATRRRGRRARDADQPPRRALGCVGLEQAPEQPGEQQRDRTLHDAEQDRVVIGPRVARRGDVAAEVEPVGQAAADELGDEREQPERKRGQEARMPARPSHCRIITPNRPEYFKGLPAGQDDG